MSISKLKVQISRTDCLLSAALVIPALCSSLNAQRTNAPEHATYDLRVPVDLVLVPVSVQDNEGKLIAGLEQGDFEVAEDGVLQKLSYFSVEPSPLSVAFLLDRTIDERTQEIFKRNMLSLVEAFSGFEEMAFYEFLEAANRMQDFTSSKELLIKPIAKVQFVPSLVDGLGKDAPRLNTSLLDNAIMAAAHDLQRRAESHRRVIFVVSNGVVSPSERQAYSETRKYLMKNQIVVYGIGQGNSLLFRKVDPLKKYTEPTGGEVLYPWKTKAFSEAYQRVSQTARNQYVLGYVAHDLTEEETYRSIRVRVIRKGFAARVRHRKGYYASLNP